MATPAYENFLLSLEHSQPPGEVSAHLVALWHDRKGEWEEAHVCIQELSDAMASRIHAYLHRKEGDVGNADYWYQRAGCRRPSMTLDEEWQTIVRELL